MGRWVAVFSAPCALNLVSRSKKDPGIKLGFLILVESCGLRRDCLVVEVVVRGAGAGGACVCR